MAFISGFSLALSLILGIGAQNIFVLKQAIKMNYAISTAVICFFCDVILIFFSVVLTTTMVRYLAVVRPIMLIFAVLFLVYYGIFSIKSSFTENKILDESFHQQNFFKVLILSMSFSLLNPQAILDIVVLLGGVATTYSENILKIEFMLGAGVASLVWFVSLMLSGLFLRKFIQKIIVWQWIERLTGVLMFVIAINCIRLLINF
ncbi:LysE/ArgO family amino acid transporter [Francisella tularensis]|uniref:Transporter, LysE family n=3 Tax=Francisella tularensis TaxID=263 RepID=Q5NE68_FRATT|nr:LysE family transporter [Francisella tularensis]ADA79495.1 Transporter, LysE family protein [Francisella tularensis subsp. tularensis NE061598]AFB79758.1 Transporter LysE family [Francisella tularensis subsp. tularensis TIGB03]AFB81302.1 Transporter LysE family [Francisella tularensis subsp. tularensis TI0902]AJI68690.1 lysE type translocator family protein [Francisella tularensis subsp. tularensis SCHU S4]AJI71347.1 lysE type translocator family protein [Francisella tularensis subsp. tular